MNEILLTIVVLGALWLALEAGYRTGRRAGYRKGRVDERVCWVQTILAEHAALPGSDPGQVAQCTPHARHAAFYEPGSN